MDISSNQHLNTERRTAAGSLKSYLGPVIYTVLIVSAVFVYWEGLESLVVVWQTPEYSHGPVIPLLSAFMFLKEMRAVPPTAVPVRDRWTGFTIILAALVVGILGNLVHIADIVTYGLILWVWGLVLLAFGLRRGRVLWPGVLHLVFMLPLPQFIYWPLTIYLQTVSSEIGVAIVALAGIPVYLEGNVIDLGVYKLQVAEACSGLRYLFPILSFSYVFGVLYTGPTWHKIVLLVSAAPITVLMNSFRIGVIGILVDNFGIEQAEGFLHAFEGWIIFIACIAILFLLAIVMQRLTPNPKPLADTLDMDFDGLGTQLKRFFTLAATPAAICAMLVAGGVAAAWHLTPQRDLVQVSREPLVLFPRQIGEWDAGRHKSLEPEIERVLGADDYLSVTFSNPSAARPVDLFVAWYRKQTEGGGIHSPEVCLPVGGWEVSTWQQERLTLDDGRVIDLNKAVIQKGLSRQLVYYWFEQRGRRIASDYLAKGYTVYDSLMIGRTDGALVRLVTPLLPGEEITVGDQRIRSFINSMMPSLPKYVPE